MTEHIDSRSRRPSWAAAVILAAGLALAWHVREILLLLFGGVLLGVMLKRLKHYIQEHTGWPHAFCLAAVLLGVASVLTVLWFVVAPPLMNQTRALVDSAPEMWNQLDQRVQSATWLTNWWAEHQDDLAGSMSQHSPKGFGWIFMMLGGMLTSSVGLITGLVVVLGIGFYLAVEPRLYVSGMVSLVPKRWESQVRESLRRTAHAITGWMLGQLGSMTFVGLGVTVGLWLLGVPHPLALGVLAGVLAFVPNLGPITAFIPAVLVALAEDPMLAVWAGLLYIGVQIVEGNLVTPMFQRKMISMPPALLLAFQVLAGTLAGLAGLLVAAPLLATLMTLVQCLYVEGVLEKEADDLNQ